MDPDGSFLQRIPPFLSLDAAARIFERDLPLLCDAQLAQALMQARNLGAHAVAEKLAPLIRAELARRRALNPPVSRSLPEDFLSSRH